MLTERKRQARAVLASESARAARKPGDPSAEQAVADARRDYYATALEEYVTRVVSQFPPLTDEQRSRIAALLRAPAAGGDRAA